MPPEPVIMGMKDDRMMICAKTPSKDVIIILVKVAESMRISSHGTRLR